MLLSRGVGRKHHLTRMKLAHHQIAETVTNRPFDPAVAPMDAAVRALEFRRDIMRPLPRLRSPLPIRRDGWHSPHAIAPRRQPRPGLESDAHRTGQWYVANRGDIGEAKRTAEIVTAGLPVRARARPVALGIPCAPPP